MPQDRGRRLPRFRRSAHAVVAAAGAIHVLGGPGTRRVDGFDGRRWTRETLLPGQALNAPAAVAVGSKLYVIGGFGGATNLPTARVRVFDTVSKAWSEAAVHSSTGSRLVDTFVPRSGS